MPRARPAHAAPLLQLGCPRYRQERAPRGRRRKRMRHRLRHSRDLRAKPCLQDPTACAMKGRVLVGPVDDEYLFRITSHSTCTLKVGSNGRAKRRIAWSGAVVQRTYNRSRVLPPNKLSPDCSRKLIQCTRPDPECTKSTRQFWNPEPKRDVDNAHRALRDLPSSVLWSLCHEWHSRPQDVVR